MFNFLYLKSSVVIGLQENVSMNIIALIFFSVMTLIFTLEKKMAKSVTGVQVILAQKLSHEELLFYADTASLDIRKLD